jgi:serine/threonine-protein kinase RsbW
LRLAVHEWIANLVQHARFVHDPEIVLRIGLEPDVVHCAIEDSSAGFDFATQLETQKSVLEAPAPSERGRGLLMLVTCTEDLFFRPATDASFQHIAFSVRRSTASYLSALFRPEDLEPEFDLASDLGLADDPSPDGPPGLLDIEMQGDGALAALATPPASTTDPS